MPDTFNCPDCGAPLDYKGTDPIIRCPYCNSSVIVPDNLRAKPAFSPQPHNFTLSGVGDMSQLVNQARRFKDVKDLAQAGNMDEATRIYTEITGATPNQARASVEALARGLPIKLSGMNLGTFTSSVQVVSSPSINTKPVDEKTSKKVARSLGCGIGCFVVGLVVFILLVTIVPALGGLAGVAVALNPKLVLTALPAAAGKTALPNAIATANASIATAEASIPTQAPSIETSFTKQELSFGGAGTGPGLFGDVRAIAVDPLKGTIFASDYNDGRVQVFDAQGKFINQWIVTGKNSYILGMAAGRNGNVYIAVFGNILVYNPQGKLLATIKPSKPNDHYEDITDLPDGSLMAVASGDSVIHLSADGKTLNRMVAAISTVTGNSELSSKIAADGVGNIYLLGTFSNAVFIFNSQGKFMNRFGTAGDEPGQFRAPSALAVDGQGRIFVSDTKGIQVFSNDGRYNNVIKVGGFAFGLAFDDQGKLYLSTNQKKIETYTIP